MLVNSPEVRADERPTSFANIILTPAGLVPRHGERLPRCHLTTENTTYILMCAGCMEMGRINRMRCLGDGFDTIYRLVTSLSGCIVQSSNRAGKSGGTTNE